MKLLVPILLLALIIGCPNPEEEIGPEKSPQENIPWPSLADSPWPMYRHDPQNTGRSHLSGPDSGYVDWTLTLTPAIWTSDALTSFAIGEDSSIYFGASYEIPDSSTQRCVFYSIDHDGNINWSFWDKTTGSEMHRSPLVTSRNTILFVTHDYIYCLDANGGLLWKTATYFESSDLNIGMDGTIYYNSWDGNLNALSLEGDLLWVKQADNIFHCWANGGISISPEGNTLYVMGDRGYPQLYALNLSGEILWYYHNLDTIPNVGSARGSALPIVDNAGNIYFPPGGEGTISFKPSGEIRWRAEQSAGMFDQYTLDINGHLVVGGSTITSYDYSGNIYWETDAPSYINGPIISDVRGHIFSTGSNLLSFDGGDGSIRWQIPVSYRIPVLTSPVIGYNRSLLQAYPDEDQKHVLMIK